MKRKPKINLQTKQRSLLEVGKLQTRQDATAQSLPEDGQILQAQISGRKWAGEDQDQQREWLRVTLGSIGDAVIASDIEGRITFLNPVAATLTGWQLEEAIGQPIRNVFRIINEKTRAPAEDLVARVLNEKRVVGLANDTALVAKDGREVPIEDSAAPIKDSASNLIGVVLVFHDVTKQRRAQAELREAYERADWLAQFPEQNPQPVIRTSADGTVLYCNPASARLRGWTSKAGQRLQNELLPLLDQAMAEGKEVRNDVELGERSYLVWVVPFLGERYATIYSRDITERKQAEEVLRQSREDLDRAQAVGQIGSWRLDVGRNVLTWSDENHRIFGLPKDTTMSYETFLGVIHPDDRQYVDTQWMAGLAGRPYDIDHRIVVDGQVKWVREKAYLEFDDAGKLLGGFGITQDITERKNMESALQKAHANLERRVEQRTAELKTALSEIEILKEQLEAENIYFRDDIKMKQRFEHIVGQSDALKHALYQAEQVAPTNTTVLILGETGTGKELIAASIHDMSPRKDRAMITVNCAALPGNLIEGELFGREKGAFTGADTRQIGRFEVANGSTICLDEIGELPLELQAKLLRVIQHNEFERLGSSNTIKVDVRIIATTNRDLEEEVRKGRFRQDLYYRLNVFPITVPPLRQRKDDIPVMVQAFMERYSRKMGKQINSIQKETLKALQDYPWPGNVRELESIIERAMILCPGPVLQLADKLEISSHPLSSAVRTLEETERNQILTILSETLWRIDGKNGAAAILGVHPSTLRAKMHKLGITRPKTKEPD